MQKYYHQRHAYFSLYDRGIPIKTEENWFSVTPELIAKHIAQKCAHKKVMIDGFCGVGGNAIQFALHCDLVIAIDISQDYLDQARHNAGIYGVADRIQFICGDFFEQIPLVFSSLSENCIASPGEVGIFLSPPWGGPEYINSEYYLLENLLEPIGGHELMQFCRSFCKDIILFLPRNTCIQDILSIALQDECFQVEQNYLNDKLKTLTVYFGSLVSTNNNID